VRPLPISLPIAGHDFIMPATLPAWSMALQRYYWPHLNMHKSRTLMQRKVQNLRLAG